MRTIEDNISLFVQNQFPAFYQEDGPNFVEFVKEYYKYMESEGNPLYYSRNLIEFRDIDKTLDSFVVHFKEKYLKYFPLELAVDDSRFLIKHVMDFYRSKGSERSYEILFKSIYNVVPRIYYPKEDLFKLSDGVWYKPIYIELLPGAVNLSNILQKEIIGSKTQATGFVESVITKRIGGRYVNVVYLTGVVGTFIAGEVITLQSNPIIEGYPRVLGSLSSVDVITGGEGFVVGDILAITTGSGDKGLLRITDVATETGIVRFTLIDGGFGFTNTAACLVSSKVLDLSGNSTLFNIFETIYQPLANIDFISANNTFVVGDVIESYSVTNALQANAVILSIDYRSPTQGTMLVSTITGNVAAGVQAAAGQFYKQGNTITALVNTYMNVTATGNLMGQNATSIGVININNVFVTSNNNYIFSNSQFYANGVNKIIYSSVNEIGLGSGAAFKVGRISNPENVRLDYTFLKDRNIMNTAFMDIRLDSFNSNTTYPLSVDTTSFNAFSNVSSANDTIAFTSASSKFSFGAAVTYRTATGNTAVGGLSNNSTYYVNFANTTTIKLTETIANIAFNASSNVSSSEDSIIFPNAESIFGYGNTIIYATAAGNTVIGGLSNNTTYYVRFANSSALKLSTTLGGANINLTAGSNEYGHYLYKPSINLTAGSNESGHYLDGPLPGYGFIKYPGGDKDAILLDCFEIDDFIIGTVASLTSQDRWRGYTKNPFVKIYDRKTGGYDKRDYLVYITEPNRNFAVGELVEQTSDTLATVLTVNTFSVAKYSFNSNTSVNSAADVIILGSNATKFSVNTAVKYTVATGNTVISGLTNNSIYYVSYANTTSIALASAIGGANINITGAATGQAGHYIERYTTSVVPDEIIYQSNGTVNVATGYVYAASIDNTGYGTITVRDVVGAFVSNSTVNTISTTSTLANSRVESTNPAATITITSKGIVGEGTNTSIVFFKRLTFFDTLAAGNIIVGSDSGASATITKVIRNKDSINIGNNAVVSANVIVANGTIISAEVYNSGFGYVTNEVVTVVNIANTDSAATVKTYANTQGVGSGYFTGTKGFASEDKYLQDGDYYQNFSYDVEAAIPFDKYKDVLKQVIHVAGTKMFGTYVNQSDLDLTITNSNTEIDIEST